MCNQKRQEVFDTVSAVLGRKIKFMSVLTDVQSIDRILENLDEVKETLIGLRTIAKADSYPGDTKVRFGEWHTSNKNAAMRGGAGGVPTLVGVEDPKVYRVSRMGKLKQRVLKMVAQMGSVSSHDLAKTMKTDSPRVCRVLRTLEEQGELKRRKAKEHEKSTPQVRFIYEVAA
jgi:hypothetical protein